MIDVNVLVGCQVRDTSGRTGRIQSVSIPFLKVEWTKPGSLRVDEEVYRRSDPRIWADMEIRTLDRGWMSLGSLVGAKPKFEENSLNKDLRKTVSQASATEVCYKKNKSDKTRKKKIFANQESASEFVSTLLDEDYEEILWRTDGQDEYWEVNLDGLYDHLLDECRACDEDQLKFLEEARASQISLARRRKRRDPSHNPFKYKVKLGPGPRGGKNKKSGEWDCTREGAYTQVCTHSSGFKKTVRIDPGYKADYNQEYKRWRAAKTKKYREAARAGHARRQG